MNDDATWRINTELMQGRRGLSCVCYLPVQIDFLSVNPGATQWKISNKTENP